MAETKLVAQHREQLWSLLVEAGLRRRHACIQCLWIHT